MNSTASPSALVRKYFGPLLAGLMLLRIVSISLLLALMIPIWLDITYPEGSMVATALDVARGRPAYQDWRQWPHAFAPYAPLTYYPVGWTVRAAFAQPTPRQVYLVGRTFGFCAVLGIFALIYLLSRQLGLGRAWSLAAVGVFGHWRMLLEFGTSYRPDAPRTFFALLALWLVLRRPSGSWRVLLAALASLYVSLWFKPAAFAEGLVLAAWTWWRFGPRRTLGIGAGFIAAGLIPFFALNAHFHGSLLLNLNSTLNFGYTSQILARFFSTPLHWKNLVLELALILGLVHLLWRPARSGDRLFWGAVVLAILTDSLLMLKDGSDYNYFFDAYALASPAAVWWIARLWRRESRLPGFLREGVLWGVVTPLVLWQAFAHFGSLRDDLRKAPVLWNPPPVQKLLERHPGLVMSAIPRFTLACSDVNGIMDFLLYCHSCREGKLDPEPLLSRIRSRQFTAIVLRDDLVQSALAGTRTEWELFCSGIMPSILKYYRLEQSVGSFCIYVPADEPG